MYLGQLIREKRNACAKKVLYGFKATKFRFLPRDCSFLTFQSEFQSGNHNQNYYK